MLISTLISLIYRWYPQISRCKLMHTGGQMISEVPVQGQGSNSFVPVCFPLILNLINFYKKPSSHFEILFSCFRGCICLRFMFIIPFEKVIQWCTNVRFLWVEDVVIKYTIIRNHLFMREQSNVRKGKVCVAHCGSLQTVTQDNDFHYSNVNPLLTEG